MPGAPVAPAPRAGPLLGTGKEGERPARFFVEWRARVLDGARLALKEAFGRVGVGDPTGQPASAAPRLRLMLEELPVLRPVASHAGAR